jgi:hypothetical protein
MSTGPLGGTVLTDLPEETALQEAGLDGTGMVFIEKIPK